MYVKSPKSTPCKSKSIYYQRFCPYRALLVHYNYPRRCLGLGANWAFSPLLLIFLTRPHVYNIILHTLRHLNAQQRHTVLQCLAHVLCKYKAHHFLVVSVGTKDRVVVVELIESLGKLVTVVGNA